MMPASVVMGHERRAEAGRPTWGRAACPQHVECSSLCPFASCLIKVPTPCCFLPKKRKVGPAGLGGAGQPGTRPKKFRKFFVKFFGCKLSNFKYALVKIQTCLCKMRRKLCKEKKLNYPICNAIVDTCHVPHGEGSGFESGAGLSTSLV